MTTVKFDFAVSTKDGTYLGLYTSGYVTPKTYSRFNTPGYTVIDVTILDVEVKSDGLTSAFGDGFAVGEFTEKDRFGVERKFPVYRCYANFQVGAGKDDRLRILTGSKFTVFS